MMAVANVIRVSLLGTLPGGEVWSVNPVWQIGGVSTAEDVSQSQAQTMADAIAALTIPTGVLNLMSNGCRHTGARVEARRWNGLLAAQAEKIRAAPVVATGTGAMPFQASLVTSLRTAGLGGSGRGRIYWPATGANLTSTTLRPDTAFITSSLAGVKTYLTSITAALNVTLTNDAVLSVWSRQLQQTNPVNQLQMGDVIDVQRRRRDNILESYSSLTFP
jgi:hypothetical protein